MGMKIDSGARHRIIDLGNMAAFLKKRKEKPQVSAGRAIRRFSAIAVGPKKPPMRPTSPSPFLNVPSNISSIAEEEEEHGNEMYGSDNSLNISTPCGPTISITADDDDSNHTSGPNTPSYDDKEAPIAPFEDTNSADGLRNYLQRMIDGGHLPGSRGSI